MTTRELLSDFANYLHYSNDLMIMEDNPKNPQWPEDGDSKVPVEDWNKVEQLIDKFIKDREHDNTGT